MQSWLIIEITALVVYAYFDGYILLRLKQAVLGTPQQSGPLNYQEVHPIQIQLHPLFIF